MILEGAKGRARKKEGSIDVRNVDCLPWVIASINQGLKLHPGMCSEQKWNLPPVSARMLLHQPPGKWLRL